MRTVRPVDFARVAKQRRVDLGYTQQRLADRLGVSRQLIARFENGVGDPALSTVLRILTELGLDIDTSVRGSELVETPARPLAIAVPRIDVSGMDRAWTRIADVAQSSVARDTDTREELRSSVDPVPQRAVAPEALAAALREASAALLRRVPEQPGLDGSKTEGESDV